MDTFGESGSRATPFQWEDIQVKVEAPRGLIDLDELRLTRRRYMHLEARVEGLERRIRPLTSEITRQIPSPRRWEGPDWGLVDDGAGNLIAQQGNPPRELLDQLERDRTRRGGEEAAHDMDLPDMPTLAQRAFDAGYRAGVPQTPSPGSATESHS